MGSSSTKPKKELVKFDLEITCDKIYHHLLLNRDRKINELAGKERDLRDAMKAGRKSYEDVLLEMISIVNLFKYIKASKIILRYCTILKDHSMQICEASRTKNMATIWELETYFQGLIWATDKLNLTYIREFNKLIYVHFGPEIFKEMQYFTKIDDELRQCFVSIEPSPSEIKDYLEKFCARYGLDDFVSAGKKPPTPPNNGGQQDKKSNEDLDAMLDNFKKDFNNNNAPNPAGFQPRPNTIPNNQYNQPGYPPQGYDPTLPPQGMYPNYQQQGYYPNYPPQGYNYGYQQPQPPQQFQAPGYNPNMPQPNNQGFQIPPYNQAFQRQVPDLNLPQDGFNYPDPQSSQRRPDQPQDKVDDKNDEAKPESGKKYNDMGDDHIKALIDSNIKKSYGFKDETPKQPEGPNTKIETKEEGNVDDLINKLKELGVTLPKQNVSNVQYDAQNYYKSDNINMNDYKIDFDKPDS